MEVATVERWDGSQIEEELKTGKANITWAVFHLSDDKKLIELQDTGDIASFINNLGDEDPYKLVEQPAMNEVKQYLVMDKTKDLPFMEDGLLKKHSDDLRVSGMLREQLEIYKKEYPWTAQMIDEGLLAADQDDCTACAEKRILKKVARAVKEATENEDEKQKTIEISREALQAELSLKDHLNDPSSVRYPCADCTRKHIAQAVILINEAHQGYPAHRWLAVGHLAEAAEECIGLWPDRATALREQRLKLMDDPMYIPDLIQYLEMEWEG
jgi:hypothetical protein